LRIDRCRFQGAGGDWVGGVADAEVERAPDGGGRQGGDVGGDDDGVTVTQRMQVFDVDVARLPGCRGSHGWQEAVFLIEGRGACCFQHKAYVVRVVDMSVDVAFVEAHLKRAHKRVGSHVFFPPAACRGRTRS
jgi:hypothetical protein